MFGGVWGGQRIREAILPWQPLSFSQLPNNCHLNRAFTIAEKVPFIGQFLQTTLMIGPVRAEDTPASV